VAEASEALPRPARFPLAAYINEIAGIPCSTREEEHVLAVRFVRQPATSWPRAG